MKKAIALLLVLAMVFALCACGASGNTPAGTDNNSSTAPSTSTKTETSEKNQEIINQAQSTDVVNTADVTESEYHPAEITVVGNNPTATLYPWGSRVSNNPQFCIYEKLFDYDSTTNFEITPILADRTRGEFCGYDHEAGTGDYYVYIYDYIYDTAGHHITSSDVKFSYEKNIELEHPGDAPWPSLESIEVVDDTTTCFHFSRELNLIDDLTAFFPFCFVISEEAYYDSLGDNTDGKSALVSDACGTGPYVLESYVNGAGTTVVKNDNYWQTNDELKHVSQFANVDKINFVAISETSQQVLALLGDEIQMINDCPSTELSNFFGDGKTGYTLYSWIQNGQRYIAPNCSESSICSDINMRLAIFYAIDVNGLCTALGGDSSVKACYSLFPSDTVDSYNDKWATWDNYQTVTDQAKVAEYLKAAGYNGETLKFITGTKESSAAQIILNMLVAAGINCELQTLDDATFKTVQGNADEWDLFIAKTNGWSGAVAANQNWQPSAKRDNRTANFVGDQAWFDELNTILNVETQNEETINAWVSTCIDNAYAMGLYSQVNNVVFKDYITSIYQNSKNVKLPGAFTFTDPNA